MCSIVQLLCRLGWQQTYPEQVPVHLPPLPTLPAEHPGCQVTVLPPASVAGGVAVQAAAQVSRFWQSTVSAYSEVSVSLALSQQPPRPLCPLHIPLSHHAMLLRLQQGCQQGLAIWQHPTLSHLSRICRSGLTRCCCPDR